jgi:hypothetical protein
LLGCVSRTNAELRNASRTSGGYDFRPLHFAFADVDAPPALILFCEADEYRAAANIGLHGTAEALSWLSDELGVPYVGLLGISGRNPMPPTIFYDPTVLTPRSWSGPDDLGASDDNINVARFAVRTSGPLGGTRTEFLAWVDHWNPGSGVIRRQEAARLGRYGRTSLPVIGGGDLNAIRLQLPGVSHGPSLKPLWLVYALQVVTSPV